MKNCNEMYVELCKDFIKEYFAEHCKENGGVMVECFWDAAENSGLWIRGTYGTAMSKALAELTIVETVNGENEEYLYTVFKLK